MLDLLKFAATHNYFWFGGNYFLQNRGVAMGAKYVPSVGNLFMAPWEEDCIYAQQLPNLALWARYIDDILLLWKGDSASLIDFLKSLNHNDRGIVLNYEMSQIHFLDLGIRVEEGRLATTFFKTTTVMHIFSETAVIIRHGWIGSLRDSLFALGEIVPTWRTSISRLHSLRKNLLRKDVCETEACFLCPESLLVTKPVTVLLYSVGNVQVQFLAQ